MPVVVAVAMPREAVEPAAGSQVVVVVEMIGPPEADWTVEAAAASEKAAAGLVVVAGTELMGVARGAARGAVVRGAVVSGAVVRGAVWGVAMADALTAL